LRLRGRWNRARKGKRGENLRGHHSGKIREGIDTGKRKKSGGERGTSPGDLTKFYIDAIIV